MDAVIRQAQLAPGRRHLRAAVRDDVAVSAAADADAARLDAARQEIEQRVRAELAAHMQKIYDAERDRACEEGLSAAAIEARAMAQQELDGLRRLDQERAASALLSLREAHRTALSQLEQSVGEVAFAAICNLLGEHALSREVVLGMVRRTCEGLRERSAAIARMHPRDLETLATIARDGEIRIESLGLRLQADESLSLGGCVVESASGVFEGSLEEQLRHLHDVLSSSRPALTDPASTRSRPTGK